MSQVPGLWAMLGGFVSTRHANVVMAKRIAEALGIGSGPGWVLEGKKAYNMVGGGPGQVIVPKETIAINALATLGITAKLWSMATGRRSKL